MPRIACLHTAQSNVAVFDESLATIGIGGVTLQHCVRADLLHAAEQAGGLTPAIERQTAQALNDLGRDADAVLLTCSTLGPAADSAPHTGAAVVRVDAALAREAVRGGGRVTVLCAVHTTVEPTRALFAAAAQQTGAEVTVHLVPDAWSAFRDGDGARYLALIAQAADAALSGGATRIALAQASMAGAAGLATRGVLLASPAAGLMAAIEATSRPR